MSGTRLASTLARCGGRRSPGARSPPPFVSCPPCLPRPICVGFSCPGHAVARRRGPRLLSPPAHSLAARCAGLPSVDCTRKTIVRIFPEIPPRHPPPTLSASTALKLSHAPPPSPPWSGAVLPLTPSSPGRHPRPPVHPTSLPPLPLLRSSSNLSSALACRSRLRAAAASCGAPPRRSHPSVLHHEYMCCVAQSVVRCNQQPISVASKRGDAGWPIAGQPAPALSSGRRNASVASASLLHLLTLQSLRVSTQASALQKSSCKAA